MIECHPRTKQKRNTFKLSFYALCYILRRKKVIPSFRIILAINNIAQQTRLLFVSVYLSKCCVYLNSMPCFLGTTIFAEIHIFFIFIVFVKECTLLCYFYFSEAHPQHNGSIMLCSGFKGWNYRYSALRIFLIKSSE